MNNQFDEYTKAFAQEQAPTPAPVNKLEQAADEIAQAQVVKDNVNAQDAISKQPDQQPEIMRLSEKYKVPASFIENNYEDIQAKEKKDQILAVKKSSPSLDKWMDDPNRMGLVHDDLANTQKIDTIAGRFKYTPKDNPDSFISDLGRGVKTNYMNVEKSILLARALSMQGQDLDDMSERIAAKNRLLQERAAKDPEYYKVFRKQAGKVYPSLQISFADTLDGMEKVWNGQITDGLLKVFDGTTDTVGDLVDVVKLYGTSPKALAYGASQSLVNSFAPTIVGAGSAYAGALTGTAVGGAIANVPGAAVGAAVGGATGFFAGATASGAALEFMLEMEGILENNKVDMMDGKSIAAAFRNPKIIEEAKAAAARKSITTATVETLVAMIGGKMIKSAIQGESAVAKGVLHEAKAVAKGQAVEVFGEAAGEYFGQAAREKSFSKASIGESLEEGASALFTGGGMEAVSYAMVTGEHARSALSKNVAKAVTQVVGLHDSSQEAIAFGNQLNELGDAIATSKLNERDKAAVAGLVMEASENAPVFMQADDFENHWKNLGEDPVVKAEQLLPGGKLALEKAKNDGTALQIPLGDYVNKFTGEESFSEINKLVKKEANGINAKQAEALSANIPNILKELSKEAQKEKAALRRQADERQAVINDIEGQFTAAGYTSADSKKLAELYAANVNANAEILKIKPADFFKKRSLEIKRFETMKEANGALFQRKKNGITVRKGETLKAGFKDIKEVNKPTLTPFADALNFKGKQADLKTKVSKLYNDQTLTNTISGKNITMTSAAVTGLVDKAHNRLVDTVNRRKARKSDALYQETLTAIKNLPALIRDAVPTFDLEDGKESYYAIAQTDRNDIAVKLLVNDKNELEDVEVVAMGRIASPAGSPKTTQGEALGGVKSNIQEVMHLVNTGRGVSKYLQQDIENKAIQSFNKDALGFYSKIEEALIDPKMDFKTIPADQLLARIEKIPGVKQEELEWSGVREFLKDKGKDKITKEEALTFVRNNGIKLEQVVFGDTGGDVVWDKRADDYFVSGDLAIAKKDDGYYYVIDRMDDLRDVSRPMITLNSAFDAAYEYADNHGSELDRANTPNRISGPDDPVGSPQHGKYTVPGAENYREILLTLPNVPGKFVKSSHFNTPNSVVHTRVSDRVDSQGNKILYIEEMQSDWHQTGRREGYLSESERVKLTEELHALNAEALAKYAEHKSEFTKIVSDSTLKKAELKKISTEADDLAFSAYLKAKKSLDTNDGVSSSSASTIIVKAGNLTDPSTIKEMDLSKETIDALLDYQEKQQAYYKARKLTDEFKQVTYADLREKYGLDVLDRKQDEIQAKLDAGVPSAPFKNTEAWTELALKNMIRLAVAQGYDKVAWTPGEVHAERWNTFKYATEVEYSKRPDTKYDLKLVLRGGGVQEVTLSAGELEANLGKTVADKIISGGDSGRLTQNDVAIDDGSISQQYNKQIPKAAQTVLKKLDKSVKLEVSDVRTGDTSAEDTLLWNKNLASEKDGEFSLKSLGFTITDKIREEVAKGQTLFQEDGEARGFLDISDPAKMVLGILAKANKSTALHEFGHAFFENMKFVNQELDQLKNLTPDQVKFKEDIQTVLDEFGLDSLDQIEVQHHEKFARMFEAYAFEGKAPTKRLQRVFNTFRTWLMNIYKNVQGIARAAGFNVEVSPEMTEVFNRLLATREEISEVETELSYNDNDILTFIDAVSFKGAEGEDTIAPDKDREAILQAHEDARSEAELTLYRKHLEQINRRETKEYKADKKAIKEQVLSEANALPVYKAVDAIKSNQIEGQDVVGYPSLKMNEAQVRELLTDEQMKSFPRSLLNKEGIDPNMTADIVGYGSAQELLDDITTYPNKDEYVRVNTEHRLEQKYPNFMSPSQQEAVKLEAIDAVYNKTRAQALQLEFDYMMKNSPAATKKLIMKALKKLPNLEQIKAQAQNVLQDTLVKEARPNDYQRLEVKNRMATVENLTKGKYVEAARAKVKEMLNHELGKQSTEFNLKLDKAIEKNKERFKKGDKELAKKGNLDMFKAAQALLAKYGMATSNQAAKLDAYLGQLKKYDAVAYHKVSTLVADLVDIAPKNYKDLTKNEIEQVLDTVDALHNLAVDDKKITVRGQKFDKEQVLKELEDGLAKMPATAVKSDGQKYAKFKGFVQSTVANMTRVEHLVGALDQGNFEGPWRKFLWNIANDAQLEYNAKLAEKYGKINEILKKNFSGILTDKTTINLSNYFPMVDPALADLKKHELVMALLHSGNDSNKRKLLLGRNWGHEEMAQAGKEPKLNTKAYDAFIQDMIAKGHITKEIMDGVQGIWDLFEEIKPEIQKAHKDVYGYYFKEVEAKPVQTPWGEYRGGYAPAVTDPLLVEAEASRQNELSVEQERNQFEIAHTPKGFTKERVQAYNKALSLNFQLIRSHVEKAVRFATLEKPVTELNKIINDRDFADSVFKVNNAWGNEVFRPWLARFATQNTVKPADTVAGRHFQNFLGYLRRNANMQLMFMNVVNTVENLTDIPALFTKMEARSFISGLKRYVADPKAAADFIKTLSPDMRDRMNEAIHEVNNEYRDMALRGNDLKGKFNKVQDLAGKHAYILQKSLQNVVDTAAWLGAYDEAFVKFNDEKKAAEYADHVIKTVMGSNRPIDIAKIEAGDAFQKIVLTFYSYFLNKGNLAYHASPGTKAKAYALGVMAPAVLSTLFRRAVKGNWDEDGDDEYIDDAFDILILSQLRFVSAIIPFGGTASRFIEGQFNDKAYDDRLSISPMLGMIENVKGVKGLMTNDELRSRDIRDTMNFFGTMSGIPIGPAGKPVGYMIDVQQGKQPANGPVEVTRGVLTGRSK